MEDFDFSTATPESLLSEVKRHPWAYFRVPQALRTKEMAVLAWKMVSFCLSGMDFEDSPVNGRVSEEEWNQFMAFLCGSYLNYVLLLENCTSWKKVVAVIDSYLGASGANLTEVELPVID